MACRKLTHGWYTFVMQVQPEGLMQDDAQLVQMAGSDEPTVSIARRSLAERSTPFTRPIQPVVAGFISP